MLFTVASAFALAVLAPAIHRLARGATGWLLALAALGLTARLAHLGVRLAETGPVRQSYPWAPGMGVSLSFYLDGLSLLFALLISGIGALVLAYSGGYLRGRWDLGRFYAFTLFFMGSMLGLVLSDNLLALFVFWELTSFSSYLLIGFDHERPAARAAALQALLVTALGGLALLAGALLLGRAGGALDLSVLLSRGGAVQAHAAYLPALGLVLLAAFSKSAQFPFHFWLPNAMEAPTPASAYLHSSTMVKAGVYLLARMTPILGGTYEWTVTLTAVGAVTMLVAGVLAVHQSVLKRLLAYSTVSALGLLVMLLGLGTAPAVAAAMAFLVAHALYKGALFLVAGAVDHATGERDVARLSGLRRVLPLTGAAGFAAGASMAAVPPLFGFIAKESVLGAAWASPVADGPVTTAVVLASMAFVAVAVATGLRPFVGRLAPAGAAPGHEPIALWLPPLLLGALGAVAGLFPPSVAALVAGAAGATRQVAVPVELGLWHGLTPVLGLSLLSLAGGGGLWLARPRLLAVAARSSPLARLGPGAWYAAALKALVRVARAQTRALQSGVLRRYLSITVGAAVAVTWYALLTRGGLRAHSPAFLGLRLHELALVLVSLLAILATVRSRSRMGAVAALGVVGYSIALLFDLYGAPDLAMTQFVVETLTVILFVLAFYHLPPYSRLSSARARARDAVLALSMGAMMTALVLAAAHVRVPPALARFYAENSLPLAHGRNVVNVILVDFRALDTLGEITVLGVAGLGALALLKLRLGRGRRP